MTTSPVAKTILLFFAILGVVTASFALAIGHFHDSDARVEFRLISHTGDTVTQNQLGGRHLIVLFGFTSCNNICSIQMSKITHMMTELDQSGHGSRVTPVFISVDPEGDTPEKVAAYLEYFDHRFVGLTGSRPAVKGVTDSFNTLLQDLPTDRPENYDITHSSAVYIVDPFSRIVEYMPGSIDSREMAQKVRGII